LFPRTCAVCGDTADRGQYFHAKTDCENREWFCRKTKRKNSKFSAGKTYSPRQKKFFPTENLEFLRLVFSAEPLKVFTVGFCVEILTLVRRVTKDASAIMNAAWLYHVIAEPSSCSFSSSFEPERTAD
jgi:hypothetical protein